MKSGIIAIKLREDDELVDVVVAAKGEELVLATRSGMAIRFKESDARPMGRNTSGVKGISLGKNDELVGMVVAAPEETLLTATANGYGKRTPFGPNSPMVDEPELPEGELPEDAPEPTTEASVEAAPEEVEGEGEDEASSGRRYRTQRRGGKGLRDIKTTDRNGPVIGIIRVSDDDEVLMMTSRGKLQRVAASEISVIGRNTQGVRIMGMDEEDSLAAIVRVAREEVTEADVANPIAALPASAIAPTSELEPESLEDDADESSEDEAEE